MRLRTLFLVSVLMSLMLTPGLVGLVQAESISIVSGPSSAGLNLVLEVEGYSGPVWVSRFLTYLEASDVWRVVGISGEWRGGVVGGLMGRHEPNWIQRDPNQMMGRMFMAFDVDGDEYHLTNDGLSDLVAWNGGLERVQLVIGLAEEVEEVEPVDSPATPVNVPEPGSGVLVFVGLCAVGLIQSKSKEVLNRV